MFNCLCACMYIVYVRAMQMICGSTLMIHGVALLVLLFQSTLCSQGLAAGRDEANPVFEVLRELGALDLHTNTKLTECRSTITPQCSAETISQLTGT